MEIAFLEIAMTEQRKADSSLTVDQALARVFMDESLQKRMRLMIRYLSAAERSAAKAHRELERVISERRAHEQTRAELQAMMAMRAPAPTNIPAQPAAPDSADRVCSATPQRC
jgi:hypothetical protein